MKLKTVEIPVKIKAKGLLTKAVLGIAYMQRVPSIPLTLLQIVGALAALVSIAQYSCPIAGIIGGVAAVLVGEMHQGITKDRLLAAKARSIRELAAKSPASETRDAILEAFRE